MTVDEAIELGKRAIAHAVHRDAYSGGINNGKVYLSVKVDYFVNILLHSIFGDGEWMEKGLVQ